MLLWHRIYDVVVSFYVLLVSFYALVAPLLTVVASFNAVLHRLWTCCGIVLGRYGIVYGCYINVLGYCGIVFCLFLQKHTNTFYTF